VDALFSLLIAMSGFMAAPAATAGGAPITVLFEERAPYAMRVGDTVHGLTADPAAQAFKAAGIAVVWEASSMSRQWHLMREDTGRHCAVGWFKNSERQAFAKFTKPISRDGSIVGLARRQFDFGPVRSLDGILALPGLRVVVRGRYSYGPFIEAALRRTEPLLIASPVPNIQLTDRLVDDRADLMFTSEAEAASLLQRMAGKAQHLQVLRFTDVLPGNERYIACNRQVSDDVITRLNSVITFK
jgi:polar amino acid transport system substrate-binding protein